MGAAFRVAITGAIVNNRLAHYLPQNIGRETLSGLDQDRLVSSTEQVQALPGPIFRGVVQSFSDTLDDAFMIAVPVAILAAIKAYRRANPLKEGEIEDVHKTALKVKEEIEAWEEEHADTKEPTERL